jgi:Domain of unknown function (DUF4111)/Nucleotidyltransferase domain
MNALLNKQGEFPMEFNHQIVFPTPYREVNVVLLDLTTRIQAILGSQFVGLYLYGSLALGDFDPQTSDIDLIVVTQSELPVEIISELRAMHVKFDHSGSPWAGNVEAAYIPLSALKYPVSSAASYPQVEKGTELFLAPLEAGWAFQRHTLRERGVVVSGPSPVIFTDPVNLLEMKEAAAAILGKWQEQARQDPGWITWVRERGCQAFVILTICRLLHSLNTGSVASKPAAARWAYQALEPGRRSLIQRALASQHDDQEISDIELKDTVDFIDEALDTSRGMEIF